MSRPATRVALLELLQDRGLVPAEELAERLRTDARTVRLYVTVARSAWSRTGNLDRRVD